MRQENSPNERHALDIAQFCLAEAAQIHVDSRGAQKGAGWVDGRAEIAPRISSRVRSLLSTFFEMACTVMQIQLCPMPGMRIQYCPVQQSNPCSDETRCRGRVLRLKNNAGRFLMHDIA
jgi:hypothetical protein